MRALLLIVSSIHCIIYSNTHVPIKKFSLCVSLSLPRIGKLQPLTNSLDEKLHGNNIRIFHNICSDPFVMFPVRAMCYTNNNLPHSPAQCVLQMGQFRLCVMNTTVRSLHMIDLL